ncbi:MAG: HAD-IA family hydrolase [Victivallales bacterium]
MGKNAVNQTIDPWRIVETGFDTGNSEFSESIFSQANEFIGTRGNFEEGFGGASLRGAYFNGIFECEPYRHVWPRHGFPEKSYSIVNGIDWLGMIPCVDGEKLDLNHSNVGSYKRWIDMRTGLLTRELTWNTRSGKSLRISFERFISISHHHTAAIRCLVTAVDCDCEIAFDTSLDARGSSQESGQVKLAETGHSADERQALAALAVRTPVTENEMACAMKITDDSGATGWSNTRCGSGNLIVLNKNFRLRKGQSASIIKYLGFSSFLTEKVGDCLKAALNHAAQAAEKGYERIFKENCDRWRIYWEENDIVIKGDPSAQQGIRFCLFQLNMTKNGFDERFNVAPKGLTGMVYGGLTFWDTETYSFPFYAFTNPKAAGDLLSYRFNHLDKYRERAKHMGRNGAMIPMVTAYGEESCLVWDLGMFEVHINAAPAFAVWLWENFHQNDRMTVKNSELLAELARFFVSRSDFSWRMNKYVINAVVGPDEYRPMSDNNAYTNALAKLTLLTASKLMRKLRADLPAEFKRLCGKLNLTAEEMDKWVEIAGNIYQQPMDDELGIVPQDDTFLNSASSLRHKVPYEQTPIYVSWPYDMVLEKTLLKQPDTLLAYFLTGVNFSDRETMSRTYRFYEPRTMHDSSLSPCIHSVLASEFGLGKQAYEYYLRSARLDLDDINKNTAKGIHTSSLGGAWMSLAMGFGGMRWDRDLLAFSPYVPRDWDAYSFKVKLKENTLEVTADKNDTVIYNRKGPAVSVYLYSEKTLVPENGRVNAVTRNPVSAQKNRGALFGLDGVLSGADTLRPDLLPGAKELIMGLKSKGWKTALCSSGKNAGAICSSLEIKSLFDAFVDGTQIIHAKPHPEIFLKASKMLGLYPGDCIVFEDAQSGIDAAKTIGAAAVGICGAGKELLGSDINVSNLSEIHLDDLLDI